MIKYAASYGRMRALKGNLLSGSDFKRLVGAQSANEVIVILGSMGYDRLLNKHESLSNNEIEHTLKQELVTSYIKVFTFLSNSLLKFANLLMQRFELTNLKTILRALTNLSSAQTAYRQEDGMSPRHKSLIYNELATEPFIIRLGKFHSLPIDDLLSTQSMEECIEILKNTPFGDASKRAYEIYTFDQNLFSLEVALELDYYNRLSNSLKAFDDISLSQIIGSAIDAKCIAWALRFRHHYKFEPEKIFQYMIADRWQFSDRLFWDATSPDDIEDAISVFSSSPYGQLFDLIDPDDNNTIDQIEILLQRDLHQKARSWFLKKPLQMGVLLAYFTLKRSEIHDLIAIIYGKLLDMPQERIERYLITIT